MYPKNILAAADAANRARRAALVLSGTSTIDGLQNAEWLLRECYMFATDVAENKAIHPDTVKRLISSILGFEASCLGSVNARQVDLEGYNRRLAD